MKANMRALITGITGQDGSYLAEFLLGKGYEVFGLVRRASTGNLDRIQHLIDGSKITILQGDITDQGSLTRALEAAEPEEVYNLAAQSFVFESWMTPTTTGEITGLGTTNMLEAIRQVDKSIRFYQASSSEMFGKVRETPQSETTPFYPRSPYGAAKAYAHYMAVNYRESYGMFCASGILFNHESPRRGLEFVTRKITHGVAKIKKRLDNGKSLVDSFLPLGNLDAKRDWGFAGDYVRAMWLMLQADEPEDFVIATGETHSVRDLARIAFEKVGLDWQDFVKVNDDLIRPAEVKLLQGDASKAREFLGWTPRVGFKEMIGMMVDSDLSNA